MIHMGGHTQNQKQREKGFSITEILVVVVVIAILAGLVVVYFVNARQRANDVQRLTDALAITTAIETYARDHGEFPEPVETEGSWEKSNQRGAAFLTPLQDGNYLSGLPLDPINNSEYHYDYKILIGEDDESTHYCDAKRGGLFIFAVREMQTLDDDEIESPGLVCESQWGSTDFSTINGGYKWITGGYLDEYTEVY